LGDILVFCFVPACCSEPASACGRVCGAVFGPTAMEPRAQQEPASGLAAETDQPVIYIFNIMLNAVVNYIFIPD